MWGNLETGKSVRRLPSARYSSSKGIFLDSARLIAEERGSHVDKRLSRLSQLDS